MTDRPAADLTDLLAPPKMHLRGLLEQMERSLKGIVIIVNEQQRIIGTVTDGDVRRAILAGLSLDSEAQDVVARNSDEPVTAPLGISHGDALTTMRGHDIRQLPLIDKDQRVQDVLVLQDVSEAPLSSMRAVVVAGGYGQRLLPLTSDTPKPMLPVGDTPLLQRIIGQIRDAGIRNVNLTTHYQDDVIIDHFGNGAGFGVDISYLREDEPLGTAGALSMMSPSEEPVLVVNGDILTAVNFGAMVAFHDEHGADMTVGVREYKIKVPYGVVESDGLWVKQISEKPELRHFVSAGVYLLGPRAHCLVQQGRRFDMTDLIEAVLAASGKVASFPIVEYWMDIGRMEDYERAQSDVRNGEV